MRLTSRRAPPVSLLLLLFVVVVITRSCCWRGRTGPGGVLETRAAFVDCWGCPRFIVAAFSIPGPAVVATRTATTRMRSLIRRGGVASTTHLRAITEKKAGSFTENTSFRVATAATSTKAAVRRPRATAAPYHEELHDETAATTTTTTTVTSTSTAFQPKVKKEGQIPSRGQGAIRPSIAMDPIEEYDLDVAGSMVDGSEDIYDGNSMYRESPYYDNDVLPSSSPSSSPPHLEEQADPVNSISTPPVSYLNLDPLVPIYYSDNSSSYQGDTTSKAEYSDTIITPVTASLSSSSTATATTIQEADSSSSSEKSITLLAPERDLSALVDKSNQKPPFTEMDEYPSVEAYLESQQIKSRPKPEGDGKWKVQDPLGWTENFGRRDPNYYETILKGIIKLQPGDVGYYDDVTMDAVPPDVTIVRTKEQARRVLDRLRAADPRIYHACDTEVMDIDLKSVGPVGHGYVTCVSIYSGPDFDYGEGPGKTLWVDNLDDACGILSEFKGWFEDERHLKVWHNYGFDRHVMFNEGIDVKGFGGDTMHMARLQDTSRFNGYSLEDLSAELLAKKKKPMKELFGIRRLRKDGTEGLILDCPPVEVLQREPQHREKWIMYSCYDAKSTWELRQRLEVLLREKSWREDKDLFDYYWMHMRPFGEVLTDMERRGIRVAADDYLATVEIQAREDRKKHDRAFRDWAATRIGVDGLAMNPASSTQLSTFLFGGAKNPKTGESSERFRVFTVPREDIPEDALEAMRLRDEAMKATDESTKDKPKDGTVEALIQAIDNMKAAELKIRCKEFGLKVSGKKAELQERLKDHYMAVVSKPADVYDSMDIADLKDVLKVRNGEEEGTRKEQTREELIAELRKDDRHMLELKQNLVYDVKGGYEALCDVLREVERKNGALAELIDEKNKKSAKVPKNVELKIESIGLQPETFSAGGAASVTAAVLQKLAGDPYADPPRYGSALEFVGEDGCRALYSLYSVGSIDTMIDNFLTSLQELADHESRVHCSLNLNTETGRLSSRKPNLQNQPALEKDKYKIRKAFQSSPGNNLIVADYGQLELRLLASMTECKSMIAAFAAGGDFHSRTAMDMFPHVKKSLDSGECILEWDYSQGAPTKPLLKDVYASERRKAKTLNFSIAYGKTAHGLSQDWGVSKQEAEQMLQAWYNARPEVRKWQEDTKAYAAKYSITRTLMGRYRQLPVSDKKTFGGAQRASINTPIQGGAADIAMMAMIKINDSKKLKQLGWILLLQIHDEVIMEGPEETAAEAFDEVLKCMQEPWVFGLKPTSVPLSVDGSYVHKTWYDAK